MKRKAISSLLCALAIIQMSVTPAYATNITQQTSTPGNQSATITYDQGSKFTVTIPKTIALDKTKTHTYNVKVEGDISADEAVTVTPDVTVAMTDTNSKNSVTGTITQEKTKFVATEVNQADGTTTTGNISAPDLKAGNWSGQFNFYINVDANKHTHNYVESITKAATCTDTGVKTLTCDCGDTYTETIPATGHNYENGTCTECGAKDPDYVSEEAGLYDADGKLLCTWEESGIDVTKDYTSSTYKNSGTPYDKLKYDYRQATKVVIPNGVSKIGNYAFHECELTDIIIPDSVSSIGESAFMYCSKLTNVTLSDNIANISNQAFRGCRSLANISIPQNVSTIGDNAFNACSSLTSITIPDTISSLGVGVFTGCSNLESVSLPQNIDKINDSLFNGCKKLTNIIIPNNVTYIGTYAFCDCESITNLDIPDSVSNIKIKAFSSCKQLQNIKLPSSISSIESNTFYGCSSLENIEIPDGVKSIGGYAFCNCSSLTDIELPNSITTIEEHAFDHCTGLTNISIPLNVTNIDRFAFYSCTGFTDITIPNSVTHIGYQAFDFCTNLASVKFANTSNWYVGNSANAKTTAISKTDLENSSTAATYLKSTYKSKFWTRY